MQKTAEEIIYFSKVVKDILEGYEDCSIEYKVEKITDWAIDWADVRVSKRSDLSAPMVGKYPRLMGNV
jgi:hypothetical protein